MQLDEVLLAEQVHCTVAHWLLSHTDSECDIYGTTSFPASSGCTAALIGVFLLISLLSPPPPYYYYYWWWW